MNDASDLRLAMVTGYPDWVRRRLAEQGLAEPDGFDDALESGKTWLDGRLVALFAQPAATQRRSPLELFQEAMRFPTEALESAGVDPVARDEAVVRALPGDLFDLAPASSQSLGDEVWHAHLAWGASKARAMATPAQVVYVGDNLLDRSAIEAAATRSGLRVAAGSEPTPGCLLLLVDLTDARSDSALRAAKDSGVKAIAFGPHVDDWALDRARSLGADQALPRSRFFKTLDEFLPRRV